MDELAGVNIKVLTGCTRARASHCIGSYGELFLFSHSASWGEME